uniref:RRP7 domain-containing protein n=1 Tax=Globodera pallida TaxID=36090 RepID=A0A183CB90_GLOPA
MECAVELQQEAQKHVKTEMVNENPPFNDGDVDAPLQHETAAVKEEASMLQQDDTTPGHEGPEPSQTDSGCPASLPQTRTRKLRGGRQFRERMERQLGSDWKYALKEQRQALANASIAPGEGKGKAWHFQKFKERMQAHKKRKALRRSAAQPPAAGPPAEMDPVAVEVAKVEVPSLVVAKDE